jgi:hypothetical protein
LAGVDVLTVFSKIPALGKLDGLCAPTLYGATYSLVTGIVQLKFVAAQASELVEHVCKDRGEEAAILFGRKCAKSIQAVAWLDGHQVDEVSRLRPSEHREHLVDSQLLAAQEWGRTRGLRREQSRVCAKVQLGSVLVALDYQPGKAWAVLNAVHRQACGLKRTLHGRGELIDRAWIQPEEIEIASVALYISTDDQRCSASEGEVLCLIQTGDDLRHPLL